MARVVIILVHRYCQCGRGKVVTIIMIHVHVYLSQFIVTLLHCSEIYICNGSSGGLDGLPHDDGKYDA